VTTRASERETARRHVMTKGATKKELVTNEVATKNVREARRDPLERDRCESGRVPWTWEVGVDARSVGRRGMTPTRW
jgi:hypothetical protein